MYTGVASSSDGSRTVASGNTYSVVGDLSSQSICVSGGDAGLNVNTFGVAPPGPPYPSPTRMGMTAVMSVAASGSPGMMEVRLPVVSVTNCLGVSSPPPVWCRHPPSLRVLVCAPHTHCVFAAGRH